MTTSWLEFNESKILHTARFQCGDGYYRTTYKVIICLQLNAYQQSKIIKPSRLRINDFVVTYIFLVTMYEWISMHKFISSIKRVPKY